jgi:type I restriction enzyme S subunit
MIKPSSGWANATIGDVAEVSTGSTPKRTESKYWENADIPWLTSSVTGKPICKSATQFVSSLAVKECRLKTFSKGTLLLAMYGEGKTRGQVTEIKIDATCNQACAAIAVDSQLVSKEFVKYRLLENYQATRLAAAGGNQPNLNLNKVRAIITPLAPLEEQKRIVEKLDSLLAQVDTIQQRLNSLPNIIKRFRQSVLAAAVSGKLTEQWRAENDVTFSETYEKIVESRFKLWKETEINKYQEKGKTPPNNFEKKYSFPKNSEAVHEIPVSWECLTWSQISMWITYGFTKPMPHVDKGPIIITAKNVRDSFICLDKIHNTTIEAFNELRPKDKPNEGDILIVKDGATTGRASLAPEIADDYCISQSVAVIWLKHSPMQRKYLLWCIQTDKTQERIQEVMAGMAMPHLSITDFGKMIVPVPPLEEQTEIVRLVEQYFALADTLEKHLKNAKQRVDNLTQAILAKAFKGELVPQDPSDEPAEQLLARIKAAREQAEALEKAAKKVSKKTSKAKKVK